MPDFVGVLTLDNMERAVQMILEHEKRGGKVYVHCKAGRTRSATVSACYLLKSELVQNPTEAFEYLVEKRPATSFARHHTDMIFKYYEQNVKFGR